MRTYDTMSSCELVTKSWPPSLVRPREPTPSGSLPLSSADVCRLGTPFALLHVFDRPIHRPAHTVRRALSRALVHYYPVAGRLAYCSRGEDVRLECTGDGVAFVAATAACTLDLEACMPPLSDLTIQYGGGLCRMSDPLLMLQVTEFVCGGYVLGVTWNHCLADTFGVAQFLTAVGELARGVSPAPSVVPVRHDLSLPAIPQPLSAVKAYLAGGRKQQHSRLVCTDATIPWSYIHRVKQQASSLGFAPTTFEVVAAAIWQCRTRVTGDALALAPLLFSANVRGHVGAKDGYYGNCITSQLVTATRREVADADILDVVKLVRHGKEKIPDHLLNRNNNLVPEDLLGALCGYGALVMASWAGLGLERVDMGGGPPARVMAHMEMTVMPTCITGLPCSRKQDGVSFMAFCVIEKHARRFHALLASLR